MAPNTLFKAGTVILLVGILLFWSIPIWLRFFEIHPWGDWLVVIPVLFWFSVSAAGTGGLLLCRGTVAVFTARIVAAELRKSQVAADHQQKTLEP